MVNPNSTANFAVTDDPKSTANEHDYHLKSRSELLKSTC